MCFNISIAKKKKEVEKKFDADFDNNVLFEPQYFITAFNKPLVPIITNKDSETIQPFNWGLVPSWTRDTEGADKISSMTFNARVETANEKPSFIDVMEKRHCLVLADGFFEWRTEGKNKIPHYIYKENFELFAFAGLWNEWYDRKSDEIRQTFSILTQEANTMMSEIHNTKRRQPIILDVEGGRRWLEASYITDEIERLGSEVELRAHIIDKSFRTMGNSTDVILPIQ